jgi:hypothetical protein
MTQKKLNTIGLVGIGLVLIGVILLVVSSCASKTMEPFKDSPTLGHNGDPALIIEMPDGFNNLATKCVGGVRYTVIFHGNDNRGAVSMLGGPNNGC